MATFLMPAPKRLSARRTASADRLEVVDVAVDHRIARQRLDRVALEFVSALVVECQFDQLD